MFQNPLDNIRKLAFFLQVSTSEEQLEKLVDKCSFDSMKVAKGHMETDNNGQPIMYRKGNSLILEPLLFVA